jgi:hypothetical protein
MPALRCPGTICFVFPPAHAKSMVARTITIRNLKMSNVVEGLGAVPESLGTRKCQKRDLEIACRVVLYVLTILFPR